MSIAGPEQPVSMRSSSTLLVEAFENLRSAGMLMTIAFILYLVGAIAGAGTVFAALSPGIHHPSAMLFAGLGAIGLLVGCAIVGLILGLIALFAKLIPGASKLAQYNPSEFATPSKLIKIGLVGLFILLLIAFVLLGGAVAMRSLGLLWGALAIIAIAAILGLLGFIGLVLLCFRINGRFGSGTFLAAGILFIISIFLGGLLSFIAWILVWAGAGTLKSKAQRGEIA